MTTEAPTKLRLVRCPKCRKVLPELPNIPVYQCGGCGTILQAKRRKNNVKDTESENNETDRSRKIELEHTSEDKDARKLSEEEVSSAGALLSNEINGSDESKIKERNGKQHVDIKISSEVSRELAKEELTLVVHRKETEVDQGQVCLAQNNGGPRSENVKHHGGVQLSDEAASSTELDHQHESEESSAVSDEAHSAMDESKNSLEQDDHPNQKGKQPGDDNISKDLVSSTEIDHQESEGLSTVARAHSQIGESINSSEQYKRRDEDFNERCNGKKPDEVAFAAEFNHHQSERSSVDAKSLHEGDEIQDYLDESKGDNEKFPKVYHETVKFSGKLSSLPDKVDEITNSLEQYSTRDEDGNSYCNRKQPEDVSFHEEVASSADLNHYQSERSSVDSKIHSEKDENKDQVGQNKGSNGIGIGAWEREYNGTTISSGEHSSSVEHIFQHVEELSPATGPQTELNLEVKSPISFESWSDENLLLGSPRNSMGHRLSGESFSTDGVMSPRNNHMAQDQNDARESYSDENLLSESPRNSMAHRFSSESFLTDGLMSPRDEHMAHDQNRARDYNEGLSSTHMPKSRTTSINYAYEGSVSSYDENDDPDSLRHVHLLKRKLKEAETGSTKTMLGVNEIRSGFPDKQPRDRNSSSVSPENNHYATRSSRLRLAELEELAKSALPVRSRMNFRTDEGTSNVPSKSYRAGYENGNRLNSNRRVGSATSSRRPEDLEEEKMELLKMVYDLQNELKRTRISGEKTRFLGDRAAPETGTFRDLNHTRSSRSCNQGRRRSHQTQDSRVPFSAEATIRRHQGDYSYCLHCCPQDWQFQALLPPHSCCNRNQSVYHSGRVPYNPHYHSVTSSPQHYASSETSDDRWRRDHEAIRIHREKTHSAKRHVRPVVGGAPLVACYKCLELLQLPADFLLFKRKVHQLQCSGCSAILKFSLQKGTNIVPYKVYTADTDTDAVAPPPSEVDDVSDANVRTEFASPSRATERVDYGPPESGSSPSVGRSPQSRSNGRTRTSSSDERKESLLKGLVKKSFNRHEGSSSKMSNPKRMSSEIEERSGSPLHKLMGYSSPSRVLER